MSEYTYLVCDRCKARSDQAKESFSIVDFTVVKDATGIMVSYSGHLCGPCIDIVLKDTRLA